MCENIELSVILAVFNKQNSIRSVYEILTSTIENQLKIKNFELIFVDDGSTDNSRNVLSQLKASFKLVVIKHPGNLGQLKALESGLRRAKGRVIVLASCDLQNPLEQVVELYRAVDEGYDCAIAYRSERLEKGMNSFFSSVFLLTLSIFFSRFPKGGFDFAAFNQGIREKLLQNDFDKIFLQLELLKIAQKVYQIPVVRNTDRLDHSGWTMSRRISYALKAIRYIGLK